MKSNLIVSIASIVLLAHCACIHAATFNLTNPDVEVTTSHPNDTSIGVSFTGAWTDSPAFTVQSSPWSFGLDLLEVGPVGPDGSRFANWAIEIIAPQYGTFSRILNFCDLGNGGWVEQSVNGSLLFSMRIHDFAFSIDNQTYRGTITGEERNATEPTGWLAPLLSLVLVAVGKHRRR